MDDQTTPSEPVDDATTPPPANSPEPVPTPVEPDSSQPTGSDTANMPPEAPESPINVSTITPVEDQNPPINQPESDEPEEPILLQMSQKLRLMISRFLNPSNHPKRNLYLYKRRRHRHR